MNYTIEVFNLCVSFRQGKQHQQVLNDISFKITAGTTVGFIGPNGAGKTTALNILLGFISPTSGTAKIFGSDTKSVQSRSKIGYLSEHPESYKFMTGREYLNMTGRLFNIPKAKRKHRIQYLLEEVELAQHANKKIGTYSRGMLQRIGIAQALINDPELLILDEPTNGLDPLGRMKIRKLIESLKTRGKTIFFSSHELSEIETVCDEIIMISDGKIIQQAPLKKLIKKGKNLESCFLEALTNPQGELNPAPTSCLKP